MEQCLSSEYHKWLTSATKNCNTSSEHVEDAAYSMSSYLQSNFIPRVDPTLVGEEQVRVFVGCGVFLANLLLLLFLNSRCAMRRRYIFFTLISVGDILDGTYLIYPSIMRLSQMAAGTFIGGTTIWGCASRGYMVFRIYGTELVSVAMFTMAAEKVVAVLFTVTYRRYATNETRFVAAAVCLAVCLVSLIVMFLTSYFAPRTIVQEDIYCGISGSTVEGFATFHQFFNLTCQIGAFVGSAFAFLVARKITKRANAKEINSIRPILVVSFVSCIVISSNNIIYILKNVVDLDITKTQQNYIVTYSSAIFQVLKFALYMLSGQEFRDCLRKIINDRVSTDSQPTQIFIKTANSMKVGTSAK